MIVRIIIITLAVISLYACVESGGIKSKIFPSKGLSLEQCQSFDSYRAGLQDGKSGKNQTIDIISKNCNARHVNIDTESYIQGWYEGLQSYCVPSTAFDLGLQGKEFTANCQSVENVGDLQNEYNRGHDIFIQISPINDQIHAIDEQMIEADRIRNDIAQTETRISHIRNNDPMGPTTQQRQELQLLRSRINNLNAQLYANTIALQGGNVDDLSLIKENLIAERDNVIEALKSESESSTP